MTGFAAEWLRLREPADARARSRRVVEALAARIDRRGEPVTFVDLGAGTGANLRYTAPMIGGEQSWLLVDDDPALLAAAERGARGTAAAAVRIERAASPVKRAARRVETATSRIEGATCRIECRRLDLAAQLDDLPLPRGCVVTCSALLDLVSAAWLASLIERCRDAGALVLFALSYDGRISIEPEAPDDALAVAAFNAHQHGDKGFGPALGPDAPARIEALLDAAGYELVTARSDWEVGPAEWALQAALLNGWLAAALEIDAAPARERRLRAWHGAHAERIAACGVRLVVGHRDIAAWPRA